MTKVTDPYAAAPTPGVPPVAPYAYGAYPARKTNGLAVASLILSIVGFLWLLPLIGSLAGAIMGHIALGQIKRTGESGRGMALAGVIIGWAGVALVVLGVVLLFVIIAASAASSSAPVRFLVPRRSSSCSARRGDVPSMTSRPISSSASARSTGGANGSGPPR